MKRLLKGLSVLVPALMISACQFPGFEPPRQTATLPPPAAPRPPPEERGIWIVGAAAMRGPVQTASTRFGGGPDTRPRLVADGVVPGFRQFCTGVGLDHPDMVASDRPIRAEEVRRCAAKGIGLLEYRLGAKQFLYVKEAHMMAVPGVREFAGSLGVSGQPVAPPPTQS